MLLIILKNVKIKVIRGKELRACCGGFYVVVITYTWMMADCYAMQVLWANDTG